MWRFVVFATLVWSVLFLVHLMVYTTVATTFGVSLPYALVWLAVLSGGFLAAAVAVRRLPGRLTSAVYVGAATWLGVVWLLFVAVVLYVLLTMVTGRTSMLWLGGAMAVGGALAVYAIVAARALVVRRYTVPVSGLRESRTIVHVTDIHIGTVNQRAYLERVVAAVNALTPDVVLITGDLFDGSVQIDETILAPLHQLTAPSYFSTGNHEEYEGLVAVRTVMSHTPVRLLENEVTEVRGLQIIGVNDPQSLPRGVTLATVLNTLTFNPDAPTILMYHTPVDWAAARAAGVDMMLSGHTHNGQIFPFTLLVRLFFKYVKGLYEVDGKFLYVSPGTGTWGPPMRLGSKNQITVLTLVPRALRS